MTAAATVMLLPEHWAVLSCKCVCVCAWFYPCVNASLRERASKRLYHVCVHPRTCVCIHAYAYLRVCKRSYIHGFVCIACALFVCALVSWTLTVSLDPAPAPHLRIQPGRQCCTQNSLAASSHGATDVQRWMDMAWMNSCAW